MAKLHNLNGENNTYINKKMIISIVSLAAKETSGVVDVYQTTNLSFKRLFSKNVGKGVKIKYTQLGIQIDIYLVVSVDAEVNDLVYRVQQNVKNSLTSLLPVKIKAINIHIMDAEKVSL